MRALAPGGFLAKTLPPVPSFSDAPSAAEEPLVIAHQLFRINRPHLKPHIPTTPKKEPAPP
jgi:hypothetical protein